MRIYDCLFDTGRDGRPELHGVRIVSHEAPELAPYTDVTFDDLSARVRPARNGAEGIEVSFSATAIRPAGAGAATIDSTRAARKASNDETAAA